MYIASYPLTGVENFFWIKIQRFDFFFAASIVTRDAAAVAKDLVLLVVVVMVVVVVIFVGVANDVVL